MGSNGSVIEAAARRAEARRRAGSGPGAPQPAAAEVPLQTAWRALGRHLPGLRDDLICQGMVQADLLRMAGARWLLRIAGAGLLAVVVATIFAIAAFLLFTGIAGGLADVLAGRIWLANLLTGAGGLILLGAAIAIGLRIRQRRRLQRLARRYERFVAPPPTAAVPGAAATDAHAD